MSLRQICLAAVLTSLIAEPAFALRCTGGKSIEQAYAEARNSPGKTLATGRLTLAEKNSDAPPEIHEWDKPITRKSAVAGFFEGLAFSGASFDLSLAEEVDVTVVCIVRNCGYIPNDQERLYLFDHDQETGALTLDVFICPSLTFWPAP